MWPAIKFKTLKWKWVESLEPPEVKHIVTTQAISESNIFAQVTVRIHSRQVKNMISVLKS